jgi:uncharacterized RDD family membrane protein YckC
MSAEGQSASSASPATPALPPGLVFADTYTRFAAYFLDSIILSVLVSIPPAVLGLYDYASAYPPEPMPRGIFVGTSVFALAIQAAYFLWFWTGGRRATPGQRVFNVQVGNAFDGQPLTMSQAVARWLGLGYWVGLVTLLPFFGLAVAAYAIGLVWFLVLGISMVLSPTKQGIHDRLARSALVRPAGPTSRWAIGCLWLYVGLLAFSALMIVVFGILLASIRDTSFYPPGPDPFEIFEQQIRELWPN